MFFPFIDDISDEELANVVKSFFSNKKSFKISFNSVYISDDNYIFLNCVEGDKEIITLHDELYNNFFPKYLSNRIYVPHITIGQTFNVSEEELEELKRLNLAFSCSINTVMVEKIGVNEESIILEMIKF